MINATERLQQKKILRAKYLNALYDATDGNPFGRAIDAEIGKQVGLHSREEIDRVTQYLRDEGLMAYVNLGGNVGILHAGVREVEQSRAAPSASTEHFPPRWIVYGDMVNSQIMQSSPGATQSGTFTVQDQNQVTDFVNELKATLTSLQLSIEDTQELRSDVDSIQSQLASSRPKLGIVKECLASCRRVLEGAAGNLLAAPLIAKVTALGVSLGIA